MSGLAGSGTSRLTTGGNCTWTASSQASWLTITSALSGTGSADIAYNIGYNLTLATRTGTLTVGGQTLTVTQASPAAAGCGGAPDADALGGLPFVTFLNPALFSYGCQIVSVSDGHPVHDGVKSARFELRAGECESSAAYPDCQTDRSRYQINENNRGESNDGRIVSYEEWIYVPPQPRFRPRGGNILFLNEILYRPADSETGGGVLGYVEVGQNGQLMIRTHRGFTFDIDRQYTVLTNPVGTWTKVVWEIKSTTQADGYIRVYVNDALMVDETKPTLPNAGWRHMLLLGIYNAFRSNATEPYDTQVVYFDGIRKTIR
ncbi:MAG TPA: heparin lyase I family protein [Vicinamibacterales bacterium]|nr:heparin lyase I family protein [Vicinamibacterales bacterium]